MIPAHIADAPSARTEAGILLEVGTYWKGNGYAARKLVGLGTDERGRLYCYMLSQQPCRRRKNGKPAMQRIWTLAGPTGPARSTPIDKATGRLILEGF